MGSTCRTLVRTQKVHTARLFPSHFVLRTGAESSSEHPFHEFLSDTFFEGFCGGPWLSGTVMAGQPARRARCLEGCCTDRGPKFQSGGSPLSQVPPAPREVSSVQFRVRGKKRKSLVLLQKHTPPGSALNEAHEVDDHASAAALRSKHSLYSGTHHRFEHCCEVNVCRAHRCAMRCEQEVCMSGRRE